jgi:hypothetical protein
MSKKRNQKVNPADSINMEKYADSEAIHSNCEGCGHVFDWVAAEGEFTLRKCLVYAKPATKWPNDKVQFATKMATVIKRDASNKVISREIEEVPVVEKICAMATHVKPLELAIQSSKVLVGQQKQKKKR